MPRTTPAQSNESNDSSTCLGFPAVARKKVTAAFDGGRLTSDGGVLLLAQAERTMGTCQRLAACIADWRNPARVVQHARAVDIVDLEMRHLGHPQPSAIGHAERGLVLDPRRCLEQSCG